MNITDIFPDYTEIGYTKKSYGVSGHVRVHCEEDFEPSLESAKHCFFLLKGCLVPYFIQNLQDGLLKFESCKNPEDAKEIVGKSIYLHNDQLRPSEKKVKPDSFEFLTGFDLIDSELEEVIGTISEVVVYPQQELAMVGEYMIPLNIHNVKGIDPERKLVFVEIPDGLLEINA